MSRIQVISLIASLLVTGFIVEQVRRRRMALEYSLIWIVAGLGMIALSLWKNGVDFIAHIMGIYYAPSAIFVIFGVIILILCVHFSLAISKLGTQNRVLVQKTALLEYELKRLEDSKEGGGERDGKDGAGKDETASAERKDSRVTEELRSDGKPTEERKSSGGMEERRNNEKTPE